MRQFCPLGCSPCLIHHWMFYSIQPGRLRGRCPGCGGACPAVGARHYIEADAGGSGQEDEVLVVVGGGGCGGSLPLHSQRNVGSFPCSLVLWD